MPQSVKERYMQVRDDCACYLNENAHSIIAFKRISLCFVWFDRLPKHTHSRSLKKEITLCKRCVQATEAEMFNVSFEGKKCSKNCTPLFERFVCVRVRCTSLGKIKPVKCRRRKSKSFNCNLHSGDSVCKGGSR